MISMVMALLLTGPPVLAPDTVVVCPEQFLETLRPWLDHRTAQGHRFAFVSNTQSAQEIRAAIRRIAAGKALRNIVLIGDAEPSAERDLNTRLRCVPTHLARAVVNVKWGSSPDIATDNWYADLDDDHIPDVAIGRITADSREELATVIDKILTYENTPRRGEWQRRINFIAGVGGFGPLVDSVLERATKRFITTGVPDGYDTSMTYASWRSPYCPDPRQFREVTIERLNEGCLFWVYIGHGQRTFLDMVKVPGRRYPIMHTADVPRMGQAAPSAIAIFLACHTGAFDQQRDCLAEEMLGHSGGPVAVLSGSRVTMPYAMAVMAHGMMEEYFEHQRPSLGEVVMRAKQRMASEQGEARGLDINRRLLDSIARALSPKPDMLVEERREHLHLFNLFGDPLLRLPYPQTIEVEPITSADAGTQLQVRANCPLSGECTVELVCRRDRLRFAPPKRTTFDDADQQLAGYSDIYRRANDNRYARRSFVHNGGPLETTLDIPADAHGACRVRIFVRGQEQFAVGNTRVNVQK